MNDTKNSLAALDAEHETRIKELWQRRKYAGEIKASFAKFRDWYIKQPQKCCYCGITEPEIEELITEGELTTKRLATRGWHLEIERKAPNEKYDNFSNLALACYWCNNAKTDTFTEEEFKQVGNIFAKIWQTRKKKIKTTGKSAKVKRTKAELHNVDGA